MVSAVVSVSASLRQAAAPCRPRAPGPGRPERARRQVAGHSRAGAAVPCFLLAAGGVAQHGDTRNLPLSIGSARGGRNAGRGVRWWPGGMWPRIEIRAWARQVADEIRVADCGPPASVILPAHPPPVRADPVFSGPVVGAYLPSRGRTC